MSLICKDPAEILQMLIRFDTSNPPGNEKDCIFYIKKLLENAGAETSTYGKYNDRPNLVARFKGEGNAPPLLIYGHADVVPAKKEGWAYPPFSGKIHKGEIWGRGALDMKGGLAMMIAALLRMKRQEMLPSGDIIFTVLSDEETGSDAGGKFITETYPELFEDVKFAIGEFGGFPIHVGKKKFYPIQIGEKQICWMRGRVTGESGHAANRIPNSAAYKLGRVLSVLGRKRLPVHVTDIVADMIETISENLPKYQGVVLKCLLNPFYTDSILTLLGSRGQMFDPLFHHNVNVTILRGGDKINVVPSEMIFEIDGRILPGFTAEDLIREVRNMSKVDMDLELTRYEPNLLTPDLTLFELLSDILKEQEPGCVPIPYLLPGITDARFFSKLGIQTYGFIPMNLPQEFEFSRLVHSENERIPAGCLEFGTAAIFKVIQRYGRI